MEEKEGVSCSIATGEPILKLIQISWYSACHVRILDLKVVRFDDPVITTKNIPATWSHISHVLIFVFPSNIGLRDSEFRGFKMILILLAMVEQDSSLIVVLCFCLCLCASICTLGRLLSKRRFVFLIL
jgi:hypothetical protein